MKMNTRVLTVLSLFLAMGAVLHAVVPPILFGMRPDMMLSMMFLGILLFPKIPYVLVLSIATGVISALTTTVPGGQISNIIDKPITAFIFFGLIVLLRSKAYKKAIIPVLVAIGTMISGAVFLFTAISVLGMLEEGFLAMFGAIVVPAAILNALFVLVIYPIVQRIMKRSQPIIA